MRIAGVRSTEQSVVSLHKYAFDLSIMKIEGRTETPCGSFKDKECAVRKS